MSSMTLDPSTALADKYRGNRQMLEAAVLGRSSDPSIDPYSALRALQKLNVADRYEQMQKAMQGQPNPPSIAQQTIAQATAARAPQPPVARAPTAPPSGGLAGMPVPEETFDMAGGGLVAFAEGGTPMQRIQSLDIESMVSPEEKAQIRKKYLEDIEEASNADEYYGQMAEQISSMEEMRPEELEQQKGLAALQAAAALSQGDNFVRGLGAAASAFGESYGRAVDAANKEKRAIMQMRLNMTNAQRQEELGNIKDARAEEQKAEEAAQRAEMFRFQRDQFLAQDALEREKLSAQMGMEAARIKSQEKIERDKLEGTDAAANYNVQAATAFAEEYIRKNPNATPQEALDHGWTKALGLRAGIGAAPRTRADAETAYSDYKLLSREDFKNALKASGLSESEFKAQYIAQYLQSVSPAAAYETNGSSEDEPMMPDILVPFSP